MLESRCMTRVGRLAVLLLAFTLFGQSVSEVEITAEPHHHLALENQYVRLFKVDVPPHESTLMHRHHHDYVFVTLGASEVSNEVAGKPAATLKLQDGEARFTPGNFAHNARNLASTPFRNVTIEFLQDKTAAPTKWDQERGLNVLTGGTQEILFVKDGVRVSEIELQPGGVLPKHRHTGPHLVVAISDLDLRNDVEGQPASRAELKSGDIKWIASGYTHTLTNVGKQQAKFVILEFR
jgi:quercetin dioxygenase-like cupin family protein